MSIGTGRLRGRTVVVTRSAEDGAELARAFEAEGAKVLLVPTIRFEDGGDQHALAASFDALATFDGIILGSQNAAERLFLEAERHGVKLGSARFFVVGEKTAAFVSARAPSALIERPEIYRAEALVALIHEAFGASLSGRRFLFPRAPEGRELIIERLTEAGAEVVALSLYHIVSADPPPPEVIAALDGADVLTFMSGRTLEHWLSVLTEPTARRHLARAKVALIGPVAKETAERLGVRVDIVPAVATTQGLVEAVAAAFGGESP